MSETARRLRATAATALVGVDAGKSHHVLVVRDPKTRDSKPLRFATTRAGFDEALAFIQRHAGHAPPSTILVGVEFAGVYGFTFAHFLHRQGYAVVSVLPRVTKNLSRAVHRSRIKHDSADAVTTVSALMNGYYSGFPFLEPVYAELRQLASGIARLTKMRGATVNRLKSVLQSVWPEYERHFQTFTQMTTPLTLLEAYPGPRAFLAAPQDAVLASLKGMSRGRFGEALYAALQADAEHTVALPGAEEHLRVQVQQLIALVRYFDEQQEQLVAAMEIALADLPEAQALRTIPGLQTRAIGAFLGGLGDVRAYENHAQVLKLAGLNLVYRESGQKVGTPRISKEGRAELRHLAYMLALTLVQKGGPFRAEYEAHLARSNGKHKKRALVSVSRSVLTLLFAIARDRRTFTVTPPPQPVARRQAEVAVR